MNLQTLISKICQEKRVEKPIIIVGLSGGPDSMYLLHQLKKLHDTNHITLVAAHLDHQWRQDSATDANFCRTVCQTLNIPLIVAQASSLNISIRSNGSKEEVGRKLRRFFFEQILKHHQAQAIALAHHLDDQQETFLMRLVRGSSLNGLRCMLTWDGCYMRPLLDTPKEEILTFLHTNKIDYLTDPSNSSDAFLRNRIRNHVLPALKSCDSRLDESFQSTLQQLKQEDDFLARYTSNIFSNLFNHAQPLQGDLKQFLAQDPVIQRRLLLQWLITENIPFTPSTGLLDEIIKFLSSEHGGSHQIGTDTIIHKKQSRFWIER